MKRNYYYKIAIILIVVFAGFLYYEYDTRKSAIETTLMWARLADLPPCAKDMKLNMLGSPFSREFKLEFDCPNFSLDTWITSSPGLMDPKKVEFEDKITYRIKPGGGALFAEVIIDLSQNHVSIRTYWS